MRILLSLLFMVSVSFASTDEFLRDYQNVFSKIKGIVGKEGPTCFISRAYTGEKDDIREYHEIINEGLQCAGIKTYFDLNKGKRGLNVGDNIEEYIGKIKTTNFVLCLFTKIYKESSKIENSGVNKEVTIIADRLESDKKSENDSHFFLPILLEKEVDISVPDILRKRLIANHQEKDLKSIFKDILTHLYVFYFKGHKDFLIERGGLIKSELEQFFNISLSTHSSLDTDVQTQSIETFVSSSLSLKLSLAEDEEDYKISRESYESFPRTRSSLFLFPASEDSLLNGHNQSSKSLPESQESQRSTCLIRGHSFTLSQHTERSKRPRSPCLFLSQTANFF